MVRVTDILPEPCAREVLGMVVLVEHGLGVPLKVALERGHGYILTTQLFFWFAPSSESEQVVTRGCEATWNKLRRAGEKSHILLYFQNGLGKKGLLFVPLREIFVGDSSHCHQGREDRLSLQTPCGHPSKPFTTRSQRSCLGNCDEAEFAGSSCQANWNCNVNTDRTPGIRHRSTILGMLIPSRILA